ncbi:MAG: heavy metal translocating P-type ATPase [Coriobacteriales bacterium]|jgi:heavy metal translocating P-type ATPase|nr:heavy metal translocating P-type ATPase [Coriobacteriales bacterium]
MRYTIKHQIPGRIRIGLLGRIAPADACAITEIISRWDGVRGCVIYPRTGSVAITYAGQEAPVLQRLNELEPAQIIDERPSFAQLQAQAHRFERSLGEKIVGLLAWRLAVRLLLPPPLRFVYQAVCALPFVRAAARSLVKGRLDVPVLDGAAIASSLLQGKADDAGSTMFLLTVGEMMEGYARDRTQLELIQSLLDVPERVWLLRSTVNTVNTRSGKGTETASTTNTSTEEEILVEANTLEPGDRIIIRTGSSIPVDGVVQSGLALVNQSSLTGESMAIERSATDTVFAGTVVEEGEIIIKVGATVEKTRLRQVVSLVEQSELNRPEGQIKLEMLANSFVPWNFLYAGVLLALTRSLERASTALMVDYSCALKLAGSISSLAALRESAHLGATVKGARSLEELAQATTLVFDKTGTLTQTTPRVAKVIAFNEWEEREVLRLAACLEEHFPHSVARAIVNEAAAQNLNHREKHATVTYIVAHGIASSLDNKRVVIGSGHFVFDDEGVPYPTKHRRTVESLGACGSPLFLAVDGELVGVICIHDPLKPGIADTVARLRKQGFERIVMLTGDNAATAARIAAEAGVDEFRADLLPEEKYAVLEELRADGTKVVMVGDGVNDSPALSCADVGIAMGDGAAIAREVANITLGSGDLEMLVRLRKLSEGLSGRMRRSFRWTMLFNTALLALGGAGILQAGTLALAHNSSTVVLSMNSARPYDVG